MIPEELKSVLDQLLVMTGKELKQKYKRTVLGFFWSFLMPLAQTVVFFIVFSMIMRFEMKNYVLYLLSGMFLWQSFSNMAVQGAFCFLGNASLIKKTSCRRYTLGGAVVLAELVHLLCVVPLLVGVMVFYHVHPGWNLLLTPLLLLLLGLYGTGIVLVNGTLNLFFRDLERILVILLQLWFFLTPVFYPPSAVPGNMGFLLKWNPFYWLLHAWRGVFYQPETVWGEIGMALIWGCVFLGAGIAVYCMGCKKFAEEI